MSTKISKEKKEELEELITSFKSANQSLRKRAIALGVLMILAIALSYSENVRYKKVLGLMDYQFGLEQVAELSDSTFRQLINGDWELEKEYFSSDELNTETALHYSLFQQIKLNNYKRDLIIQEIDEVDKRIESCNQQQSIGLLGLTIPFEPVAYLSLILVLIVFHDFTQIIIVRNYVYRRIRGQKLAQWRLGIEFFGFHSPLTNTSTLKFMRFTSSVITGMLIVCPLITSYLMMDLNNSNNKFLFLLNAFCFLLIVIDTVIIFHTENIGNFRYFCNFYLGRHNMSKFSMKMIWGCSLGLMISASLGIGAGLISRIGIMSGLQYCLMGLIPPILLFFALVFTQKNPTKRNRAVRTSLLMINLFWIVVICRTFFILDRISEHDIDELGESLVYFSLFCLIYSIIYKDFFMDGKKVSRKPRIIDKS